MEKMLEDGTRLQSQIPMTQYSTGSGRNLLGTYIGVVTDVIFPKDAAGADNPKSISKRWIEVTGTLLSPQIAFTNAIVTVPFAGVDDVYSYVPKKSATPDPTKEKNCIDPALDFYDVGKYNGDRVLVQFLAGNVDAPIVTGFLPHFHSNYYPPQTDIRFILERFGLIDETKTADGEYSYKPQAADAATVKGNYTIDLSNTSLGVITIKSKLNTIIMDSNKIEITESHSGNKITMENGKIVIAGTNVEVLGNSKGVARKDDIVTSDSTTDAAYWAFILAIQVAAAAAAPLAVDPGAASFLNALVAQSPFPTQQQGKITTYSANLKTG